MANIKIYKCRHMLFGLSPTVSEILTFQIVDLQKVGEGH